MTGPKGNSDIRFPEAKLRGTLRVEGENRKKKNCEKMMICFKVHNLITCKSKVQVGFFPRELSVLFALGSK